VEFTLLGTGRNMARKNRNSFLKRQKEMERVRKAKEKMNRRQGKVAPVAEMVPPPMSDGSSEELAPVAVSDGSSQEQENSAEEGTSKDNELTQES